MEIWRSFEIFLSPLKIIHLSDSRQNMNTSYHRFQQSIKVSCNLTPRFYLSHSTRVSSWVLRDWPMRWISTHALHVPQAFNPSFRLSDMPWRHREGIIIYCCNSISTCKLDGMNNSLKVQKIKHFWLHNTENSTWILYQPSMAAAKMEMEPNISNILR